MYRYHVVYTIKNTDLDGYAVEDGVTKRVIFQSHSKSEVVAHAQVMNGFAPVDGDDKTYARQTGGSR